MRISKADLKSGLKKAIDKTLQTFNNDISFDFINKMLMANIWFNKI